MRRIKVINGSKSCSVCKEFLLLNRFFKDKSQTSGYDPRCKGCRKRHYRENKKRILKKQLKYYNKIRRTRDYITTRKNRKLIKEFGITLSEYLDMCKAQDGKCFICQLIPRGRRKVLFVDHDHKTGKVRGLLCYKCNMGLGYFKDSAISLRRAISYLCG